MIHFAPTVSPTVSVLVVGWRDAPRLVSCLDRMQATIDPGTAYEVLVALNEPTPALLAEIDLRVDGARVVTFSANLGFGGAVDHLASHARGDHLALINDDCLPEPGWLEALLDTLERRPSCGVVGSRLLHPDGTLQEAGSVVWSDGWTQPVGDGGPADAMGFERRVDYCSAAAWVIRRSTWDEVGGFDEAYYPAYYEDVDLCMRAAALGWQVWYQPRSIVGHERSASTTLDQRSFLMRRNRAVFGERHSATLAARRPRGDVEGAIWTAMGRPTRVLVIDDELPNPRRGSGFGRMRDVLSVLASADDLHVVLHPRRATSTDRAPFGREGIRIVDDLRAHLVDDRAGYDVVVVSRPHNLTWAEPLLDGPLAGVPLVYDAEALYHRREAGHARLAAGTAPDGGTALARAAADTEAEERRMVARADHVVCISEQEAAVVRAWTGAPVTVVEPWLTEIKPSVACVHDRRDLAFVAGWMAGDGSPNVDGLQWFAREVLPRVRARRPGTRLLVTGGDPPPAVRCLAGPAIELLGEVVRISDLYDQVRLAVAPIRFGSGVKLKTVEAVQHCVPIVATAEGAAGLASDGDGTVAITDDPVVFADSVLALLDDDAAWHRVRRAQLAAAPRPDHAAPVGVEQWPDIIRTVVGTTVRKALA